jgi:membrane-bound serine protease (ClpP class)
MMLLTLAQDVAADAPNEAYLLWGFILFGAAVLLLGLEFFVPSGGMIAILCGVAAVGSVVAFFQYNATLGIVVALGYVVLTPFVLVFIFKLWLNSPIAKLMILDDTNKAATGDLEEAAVESEAARRGRLDQLKQLIGAEGVTETALRPVGTVRINDQRVDGMAESGVIEAHTPVIVTEVYDNQIKVRPR